jgi:hypothetical protein
MKKKSSLITIDTQRLVHELQVRQVELETDNRELRRICDQQEETSSENNRLNRSVVESSPDCIKVLDLAGNLLSILHGAKKLLGTHGQNFGIPKILRRQKPPWLPPWRAAKETLLAFFVSLTMNRSGGM